MPKSQRLGHFKLVTLGAAQFEREKVAWPPALRSAVVVTVCVSLCLAAGQPANAIPLGIGALFVGLADVDQVVGQRWRTMMWTTLWITIAALFGGLLSSSGHYQIILVAVVGAIGGYVGAAGARPVLIGILAMVTYVAFSGAPEPQLAAFETCALIALGGIIQTAVTVITTLICSRGAIRLPHQNPHNGSKLRAHFNTKDDFFRHGARLALAMAIAECINLYLGWPHGYWIPLTVAWVSRPDRNGTTTKVIARVAGSIAGVIITYAAIEGLNLQSYATAVLIGAGAFVLLAFIWANYAIAVIGITVVVISLVSLNGDPVGSVSFVRVVSTIIAGIVVIVVSFCWPAARMQADQGH